MSESFLLNRKGAEAQRKAIMIIAGGLTLIAGAILYGSGAIARANNPSVDGHEQFLAWIFFLAGFVQIGFEVLIVLNTAL